MFPKSADFRYSGSVSGNQTGRVAEDAKAAMERIYGLKRFRSLGDLYAFLEAENVVGRRTLQKWWNLQSAPNDAQWASLDRVERASERSSKKTARTDEQWRTIAIAAIHNLDGEALREFAEKADAAANIDRAAAEHRDAVIDRILEDDPDYLARRVRENKKKRKVADKDLKITMSGGEQAPSDGNGNGAGTDRTVHHSST